MATIADNPSDDGVILLFDKAGIVLTIATGPGKGNLLVPTIPEQVSIDEFTAVIGIYSEQGKGQVCPDVFEGFKDPALGLIFDCLCPGPATSVTSSVCKNSPEPSPPSCPTRSISTNPGLLSFHSEKVRIGI